MSHISPENRLMHLPALRFTEEVEEELARRRITLDHVREMAANGPVILGRRVVIGPDDHGRIVTLAVEPTVGPSWRVKAGWPAERAEIVEYRRAAELRRTFGRRP